MQITRLRLAGFKSFVEPTELRIEPGLTGVVGPNGCGKSNLVEALRWAMGESSARRMRASELEDVIFAGTAARPSRNFAEVALALDNSAGLAPPPYREQPVIEVVRRLPRGGSSAYRVNGRAARARDVQRMLADAATGARSTAIVAQGQIGAFVAAKPTERRGLLEEAAGVAGLYTRRQEAESRLRAAETNLERLEDVLATITTQRQGLEKQARQARRYRKLKEQAAEAETLLYALRWQIAQARQAEAAIAARDAAAAEDEAVRAAAHAAKLQADAAAALPGLRKAEAEAMAAWQRLAVECDSTKGEATRVADEQKQVAARIKSLEADLAREASLAAEAAEALASLQEEANRLASEGESAGARAEMLAAQLAERETDLAKAESAANSLSERLATATAERNAAAKAQAEAETRLAALDRQTTKAKQEFEQAAGAQPSEQDIAAAQQAATAARRERNRLQAVLAEAREAEAAAAKAAERAENQRREADRARLTLATEAQTLRKILTMPGSDTPLLDHLHADSGFEAALVAALGEDVAASLDCEKPLHWRDGVPVGMSEPPPDCEPLAPHVRAPSALDARLAQVWVAPDPLTASALAKMLHPGQRLVTKDGGMWRWDGYTALSGAPTAAAVRLEQRNRLRGLDRDLAAADDRLKSAASLSQQAVDAREAAVRKRNAGRDALREAESILTKADQRLSHLSHQQQLAATRVQGLTDTMDRLESERAEWADRLQAATKALNSLASPETLSAAVAAAKAEATDARTQWLAAHDAHDRHAREERARRDRLQTIARDVAGWQKRAGSEQRDSLSQRLAAEQERAAALAERPAALKEKLAELASRLVDAEAARNIATDSLVTAETALAERDRALKEAESLSAAATGSRIRAEATREQADQSCRELRERLQERLGIPPSELPAPPADTVPDELEQRLARLEREIAGLGDVNLRADREIEELEERLATLIAERDDLTEAIAKLRRGIGDLNRNARSKLLQAYESVDRHFGRLFTRLFGGGEARLQLVGNDDPLEAGLEVFACPPGKKPQALTALSGGERALTAVALLFAAFLTNPAPICVLDEVDAPLDDANVDRLCHLIEEIADEAGTRFLCITHHRLTMARMDRLYGVTMEERGVSRLVSVDLRQADRIRKTPPAMHAAE